VFFFGENLGKLISDLDIEFPHTVTPAVNSFKSNLRALYGAAQLPYLLSFHSAYMRLYDRHMLAEEIRALDPADITEQLRNPDYEKSEMYRKKRWEEAARARAHANETFVQEHMGAETTSRMEGEAINNLAQYLRHEHVCVAAQELMRHSAVLIWVALEALASDLFVVALNSAPQLTVLILRDEHCKKRFQSRDLARIVEEHGFELSGRMGEVLRSMGNLDDPETIKAVFRVICPSNEPLRTVLSQPEVWRLYQRRNLLVHRAGIVDKHFLEKPERTL
jgi:hypothetical protein